ncbi:MAG TPA: D-glycero-beta-D-manno-heptose 1-phosphate adenylyltransferase [Bacteroidetes bacterium]|nr:D-glycero-beta-D-manno-heptose 1-phosphate adenylyltransferase [Bacteroidota bacterium]
MNYKSKIYKELDASYLEIIKEWQKSNKKIVFTNGCFDLLHSGHIAYLNEAAGLGDKLVVGLNSDLSVRNIKGETRPIKTQQCRADILAFMSVVDLVVIFDEDTPFGLIEKIVPDVLVKGGDWKPEQIVGSDIVLKNGGKVKSLSYIKGYSSSKIIEKISKAQIK